MRDTKSPDFIEAVARGLDVLRSLKGFGRSQTLTEVAAAAELARPTARRVLITLEELGYVRASAGRYALTPRVLELGLSYYAGTRFWEASQGRLEDLVAQTGESCSIAQLDGSDVVYAARVAVPKLVTLSVSVGTRFPALQTSLGKVLLAWLGEEERVAALSTPSRSGIVAGWQPEADEIDRVLDRVRERGWAASDQQLAPAIRSIAAPIRRPDGAVFAAVNVNAHAAETSMEDLVSRHLPNLLRTAAELSVDAALMDAVPQSSAG